MKQPLLPRSLRIGLPPEYVEINHAGVRCIELVEEYHRSIGNNLFVKCPVGTVSNFATIPKLAHFIFKPDDPIIAIPAIVHDCLVEEFTELGTNYAIYSLNADDYEVPIFNKPSWDFSANIFHSLMVEMATRQSSLTFKNRVRISLAANAVRAYKHFR